jgi:hypothetical protein
LAKIFTVREIFTKNQIFLFNFRKKIPHASSDPHKKNFVSFGYQSWTCVNDFNLFYIVSKLSSILGKNQNKYFLLIQLRLVMLTLSSAKNKNKNLIQKLNRAMLARGLFAQKKKKKKILFIICQLIKIHFIIYLRSVSPRLTSATFNNNSLRLLLALS